MQYWLSLVRSLRYSPADVGASGELDSTRPLAIVLDPRGVVQYVRAGFNSGDERALLTALREFAAIQSR